MNREALTTDLLSWSEGEIVNEWTVLDEAGGRWHPSDEAREEINAADDPEATALRICVAQPMRGTWHS
jgi:hypothetical protein